MRKFNPNSRQSARALQAWQILIASAMNRQTLTYKMLSKMMFGREAAGVLDEILGHIAYYCNDNGCPPLTVLVVNKSTGEPGSEIPTDLTQIDELREKVYCCDWYDIYPPSEVELSDAFARRAT
jgi:hypothetical protein